MLHVWNEVTGGVLRHLLYGNQYLVEILDGSS